MRMVVRLGVIAALMAPAVVRAEHDHGEVPRQTTGEHPFAASVGLVAARYETMLFVGDYQGVIPGLRWTRGRITASAQLGMYRVVENGRSVYGVGDVVATGQAALVPLRHGAAGVALAVSAPTGNHETGLGMGHPMVMPSVWASIAVDRVTLAGSAGFGRAFGGAADHAGHGSWPIVDPMSRTELTGGATVSIAVTPELHAGARATGAVPIGDGVARLIGGLRAGWAASSRVETTVELQAGLAGDPFTVRGVVATSLNF